MALFLRPHERKKNGKVHTYWSLVENRRCSNGRIVQRQVLYLGALTTTQQLSWEKTAHQLDGCPDLAGLSQLNPKNENIWGVSP